jgi:hypothetical protein
MKCKGTSLLLGGCLLGFLLFVLNTTLYSNRFLYFGTGIFLGDLLLQGRGESGLLAGLLVGLLASMATSVFYCYVICRIVNRRRSDTKA